MKNKKQNISISTKNGPATHKTVDTDKITQLDTTLKKTKKSRIIRVPKIVCIKPFLMTLFNDLSTTGAVRMDANGISKAVDIISNAKMDLEGGNAWNGKIKIAENFYLKLYKSGLVLHLKK